MESKTQDISRSTPRALGRVNAETIFLADLTAKLQQNLRLCSSAQGEPPSVEAVHDVRTGTRRIEAVLDAIEHGVLPGGGMPSGLENALGEALAGWRRLLRKIRRSAGSVRDLDVHRGLLAGLLAGSGDPQPAQGVPLADGAAVRPAIQQQAAELDAWLEQTRSEQSRPLVRGAAKWAAKLEGHLGAVSDGLAVRRGQRTRPASAAVTALDAFARLSSEMQQLYAENLHDFRKGAKKARYMAETGGADAHAGAVGKALKKLQDEIGGWHDWLVLAEEAHRALGGRGVELIARIEQEREEHYRRAMKTAERMRGRLMGEWRASTSRGRRTLTG